ncbi:MAG: precorrin-3B C(17)-methyltransferase [Desulfobacteraceae bacterium]|nr:MAG: precorrin-3B C(17)-methyltransferase [Desulfobacteraceae bacterium]
MKHILYVVGTGPGDMSHMSKRAVDVISGANSVAGYSTYIELIRELIPDKKIISTGMMKEVERVEMALEEAMNAGSCALISGGDPGVYAMAGLVFEICREKRIPLSRPDADEESIKDSTDSTQCLRLEIVPGIPALAAGASLVGAPLTHDFAAISLSDLLTPWEVIEKRLTYAAQADFVIVLYNPKSKKRDWQLKRACDILLDLRSKDTPVGIVTGAMRENQSVTISCLKDLENETIDMQTVVFIGSTASLAYLDYMYTPRGYLNKYGL